MFLLISCKHSEVITPNDPYPFCAFYSPIRASCEDKLVLKQSTISKQFIEDIVNNNEVYKGLCPVDWKITNC